MPKNSKNGVYVSTSPDIEGVSGRLFHNKKPIALTFAQSYKEALWQKTKALLNNIQ